MRKKIVHITLILAAAAITIIAFGAWKSASYDSSCEESMEECCQKKKKTGPDAMIWEALPGQFFSSAGF